MISRRLIQQLDGYKWKGWTCYWEYPGFFLWSRPNHAFSIAATPDYNRRGYIDIEAFSDDGVGLGGPSLRYQAPLDRQQYLRLVTPWLKLDPFHWDDGSFQGVSTIDLVKEKKMQSNPAANRVTTYTTAPEDYDWFGTSTVKIAGTDKRGKTIRKVVSDPQRVEAQRDRYASGLHMAVDETEWKKLVKYKLVQLKLNENPYDYGGHGVKVELTHMRTTPDVFWSKRGNSYVIVRGDNRSSFTFHGTPVDLVSVNGIGEVRWPVWGPDIERAFAADAAGTLGGDAVEQLAAFHHFGLTMRHKKNPRNYGENPCNSVECLAANPPKAQSGYAYSTPATKGLRGEDWQYARDDDWDTVVITPKKYTYLGTRLIDGARVNVWHDRAGQRYVAQTTVLTGYAANPDLLSTVAVVGGLAAFAFLVFWPRKAKAAPPCVIHPETINAWAQTAGLEGHWITPDMPLPETIEDLRAGTKSVASADKLLIVKDDVFYTYFSGFPIPSLEWKDAYCKWSAPS